MLTVDRLKMIRTLRNMSKMATINDGTRSLVESTMVPELNDAMATWIAAKIDAVLIGGLAISYYGKPRTTQDADFLFMTEAAIPATVEGFRRVRAHGFQHNETHVTIEVLSPEFLNIPTSLVEKVFATARQDGDVKIASPSGLVAMKLFRLSVQDRADIISLIIHETIDLTGFGLPSDRIEKYLALMNDAEEEKKIPPLGE